MITLDSSMAFSFRNKREDPCGAEENHGGRDGSMFIRLYVFPSMILSRPLLMRETGRNAGETGKETPWACR